MKWKYLYSICSFTLLALTTHAQTFRNLAFRQTCDSSKTGLCAWDLSWGGKDAVKPAKTDGKPALLIQGNTLNAVGFSEQSATIDKPQNLSIINISSTIKTEDVEGKGAGLNIGLYDAAGNLIANKDMGGFYSLEWIQGSTPWAKHSISVVCPIETRKIKIGSILYGKGKAWFSDYRVTVTPLKNRTASALAIAYVGAACDSIKKHSLVRDSINMDALRQTALQIAGPAKTYADCYLSIEYLLESLRPFGDEHSFFMKAAEVKNWKNEGSQISKIEYASHKIIDSCGYISVPPFHGGNQEQILAFTDSLQVVIQQLYLSGIKGWIIDLRQNTGGNMAPMIAGLGPLFSSEKLGALVDVNQRPNAWYYRDGRYSWDDDEGWQVSDPVRPGKQLPIAVLTGNQTGSSGEAVVVSFIGNDKTRSFGQATWGLTTGNGSFDLMDGSQIYLASTIMADRNGKQYKTGILPDQLIKEESNDQDATLAEAIKWIYSQK
jgi:hypothetical protein